MHANSFETPDGRLVAPAFSFMSEPNSGLIRVSAGVIGVVIQGVLVARFSSVGLESAGISSSLLPSDGEMESTGAPAISFPWTGGIPAALAVTGTDATPANGTTFVSGIIIPHRMTITGVSYLIGSVGGTNKVYAAIWNAAGTLLANSDLASGGATVGTAATMQDLALTAPIVVTGPARYFIGIAMNGNTARLRTHLFGKHHANSVAQTHGTIEALVPATLFSTIFTASKGPYATVY